MTEIHLPYGKGSITLHVPQERLAGVLRTKHSASEKSDQQSVVRKALAQPFGSPRLCELARGKKHALIITSDHTRPVPSHITMPLLLEEVRRSNPSIRVTLLIATGMHRPTTEAELRARFGNEIVDREEIAVHRAGDDAQMAFFGTLPSGGELWLNRLVAEADLVVSEGFIEPHFFAGFSGGRKSILPGVASEKTVLYNHNARFIQSPHARQGSLDKNPIHADMVYAAQQARLAFILNVLIDEDHDIYAAVAGDHLHAHREGCEICARLARVPAVPADIVVTSNGGYPLDQNLYQCVKGMTAAERCVRSGGAIILCAALGDGHGGEAFFRWFSEREDAAAVWRDIACVPPEETHMDQWEAQILARVMLKASCWIVTSEDERELVERMHMHWAPDADAALAQATAMLGREARVVVIPDGVGVIVTEGEG